MRKKCATWKGWIVIVKTTRIKAMRRVLGLGLAAVLLFAPSALARDGKFMDSLKKRLAANAKLGVRAPEFPAGLDWLNVSAPLRIEGLRGKIVLLHFWTYSGIHCLHVIPDLKRLEEEFPGELVVIGVHSAKFANEKVTENIRQSILRYEIAHPVVNDHAMETWGAYGARAWPTLVLIDPEGNVVLSASGEGNYDLLRDAVQALVEIHDYRRGIDRRPLRIGTEAAKSPASVLRFPGKIWAGKAGLVIADSTHNQILVAGLDGRIQRRIGKGSAGAKDGSLAEAQFHHPQGVFREGKKIYVADTGNHLVREIDVKAGTVKTIAGTGTQGVTLHAGQPALETALNSPWDLVKAGKDLYIAMAGAHQIWALRLEDKTMEPIAGSGRVGILDGRGEAAALAQPSGITFDGKDTLYFADSEGSAVRSLDIDTHEVRTLIGKGLFDSGDKDGAWQDARLAHCLGIHYLRGLVYVADTYNHKVRVLDPATKTVRTISGTGRGGFRDGTAGTFYEPDGLSAVGNQLYVADTDNHAVRVLDLTDEKLRTLPIVERDVIGADMPESVRMLPLQRVVQGEVILTLAVEPPLGHHFTEGAGLEYEFRWQDAPTGEPFAKGGIKNPSEDLPFLISVAMKEGGKRSLIGSFRISYSTDAQPESSKVQSLTTVLPFAFDADGARKVSVTIRAIPERGMPHP